MPAPHGRIVKISPAWRVYILGATLCVALTICSRKLGTREPSFIIPLAVAGIAYLLAIREFLSTPRFPRRVIIIGLVLAALWHLPFLLTPPGADDDIHRYVWDGRVQRLGYNPYIVVPSDPALAGLHTPETRTLNNPDLPSPYPAGAQLFFRAVTAIHESIFALKVAFVVCDFAIVLVLLDILHWSGQGSELGSGLCLAPTAGDGSSRQWSHRYCRCPAAVGICCRARTALAPGRSRGLWSGCRSEISSYCAAATLLEACSRPRRRDGSTRGRTALRTILES